MKKKIVENHFGSIQNENFEDQNEYKYANG